MPRTDHLFGPDGTTTVAIDVHPEVARKVDPANLVRGSMDRIVRACREIGARPIRGETPVVLSEREMRDVIPDAVLARPGRVWIAVPVRRDSGETRSEVVVADPD